MTSSCHRPRLQVLIVADVAHHRPLEVAVHQHARKQFQRLAEPIRHLTMTLSACRSTT